MTDRVATHLRAAALLPTRRLCMRPAVMSLLRPRHARPVQRGHNIGVIHALRGLQLPRDGGLVRHAVQHDLWQP